MTGVAFDGALEAALAGLVGARHVVTDPAVLAGRCRDWTGRWRGSCRLAVSPADGAQTAAVLRRCAEYEAHVVVQGGNTGLAGGAVPEPGDVLLLTGRLRDLGEPDPAAHTVVVGAGVTLAELQAHVRPRGYELAVDLAARDSATLGGMAATNAGGTRVLRDGDMRRQVLSVDAYDVAGNQIAVLHPLVKDNTGYALAPLLVGSEGTLAVIARLLLRVVRHVPPAGVVLLGLPSLPAVVAAAGVLRRDVPGLDALEVVSPAVRDAVAEATGASPPLAAPWYLLAETAAVPGGLAELGVVAEGVAGPDAVVAADDTAGMRALWRWRDGATEAIARHAARTGAIVVKLDVSLPSARLAAFAADLDGVLAQLRAGRPGRGGHASFVFGHVGDNNLHVNVLEPDAADEGAAALPAEEAVLRLVAAHGGSISAEHGIGRAKARWLDLSRTPAEQAAMRAVKAAFDPDGRLGRAIFVPAADSTPMG